MRMLTSAAAIALAMTAGIVAAHPAAPIFHEREVNQAQRIAQGVASGALTPREARKLRGEQRTIRHEERIMRSDGVLTTRERAQLSHDQNVASRDIWREKHDGEHR